jgi:hypothetical protein
MCKEGHPDFSRKCNFNEDPFHNRQQLGDPLVCVKGTHFRSAVYNNPRVDAPCSQT